MFIGVALTFFYGYDGRIKSRAEYSGMEYSTSLETAEDMKKLAEFFDVSVKMPPKSQNIRIPMRFNEVYENYNELQYDIGMDLEEFKGEKCVLYTFDTDENSVMHIISWNGQFIGGDISDRDFFGKIISLSRKSA